MLRPVTLVTTDVSEELSAFIIKMTGIGELWTTLAVISNRRTLQWNTNTLYCTVLYCRNTSYFFQHASIASLHPLRFLVPTDIRRLSQRQGHNAAGSIRWFQNVSDVRGNRSRVLSACMIVPRLLLSCSVSETALPSSPLFAITSSNGLACL
jgi:hypothetical protein